MKRTISGFVFSATLVVALMASLAWIGQTTVKAQETESAPVLELAVGIETADGQAITIPLQIDNETFAALMELAPADDVINLVTQLAGSELQTITVVADAAFTPVATSLLIQPLELLIPPSVSETVVTATVPVTETGSETTAVTDTVAVTETVTETGTATLAITVPPATKSEPPIVTSAANKRNAPTIEANVIGQIAANTEITVTGRNSDGSWLHLDDGAWIASFLVENAPASLPIVVEGATTVLETIPATITGGTVVLREGPSQSDASIKTYEGGTVTAVINRSADGDWLEILTPDGEVGWMSAEFLDVAETLEGLPAVVSSQQTAIRGQVVDGEGEGIGGIVISATQTDGGPVPRLDATTASDGSFTFYMTPSGATEWTVRIAGVGCDSRIVNERCQLFGYFAAAPTADVVLPLEEVVTLVYEEATSFIAGTVVDADGEPVGEDIRVSAEREDGATTAALTSSSGKFVLPADTGVWEVSTESGPALEVEVPEKSAPEPIELAIE